MHGMARLWALVGCFGVSGTGQCARLGTGQYPTRNHCGGTTATRYNAAHGGDRATGTPAIRLAGG